MRIAISGATGLVGSSVRRFAESQGHDVLPVVAQRISTGGGSDPLVAVDAWVTRHGDVYAQLVSSLTGTDVLVNAAGLAAPGSTSLSDLRDANSALPVLLARAARSAGIRRMVHVSSAAVQGRRDPLDESEDLAPLTPYASTKALAERLLLGDTVARPPEVIVYRPTSVQAPDKTLTQQLVRLASRRLVPICGTGAARLPVALIENVAAAIIHLCTVRECPGVVLHPWEGMTTRTLLDAFGARRYVVISPSLCRPALRVADACGSVSPHALAIARRLELLVLGQRQEAHHLARLGFSAPIGRSAYELLAARVRRASA